MIIALVQSAQRLAVGDGVKVIYTVSLPSFLFKESERSWSCPVWIIRGIRENKRNKGIYILAYWGIYRGI